MKRAFLIIIPVWLIIAMFTYVVSADTIVKKDTATIVKTFETSTIQATEQIQDSFWTKIVQSVNEFLNFSNGIYLICFLILIWMIGDHAAAVNRAKWLSFWDKIPQFGQFIIIGGLLLVLFYWGFSYDNRLEVMHMILAMFLGMLIYKLGEKKVFNIISNKMGINFNAKPAIPTDTPVEKER